MKIAFVTRSLGGGGAERVVSVLANEFSKTSTVKIISVVEDYVTYDISTNINYVANKNLYQNKLIRVYKRLKFLKDELNSFKPDVVISFCAQINIYSIFAVRSMNCKLIVSERNDPNRDPIQSYVRRMRDIVYRKADGFVFQTEDAAQYFENIIKKPYKIIGNPIIENLPEPYIGPRRKAIVCVARLSDEKNQKMLICAFKKLLNKHNDYFLELYGQGPSEGKLRKLVADLKLEDRVLFMGFEKNVHKRIKDAMCFVLPSNYEGISNAMLEALALGIPTICTDCPIGGARMEIQNGKNGLLIPVNGEQELVNALDTICSSKSVRDNLSIEAIKIRGKLSVNKIVKLWKELIFQVMDD